MPEIKHNFTAGRMNKDADERLVRNGEYTHAVNVQVRTTDDESRAAGTVQNIKGNTSVGLSYFQNWMAETAPTTEEEYALFGNSQFPQCIASIADEKNDTSYFFFASSMTSPLGTANLPTTPDEHERVYMDIILEHNQNDVTTPVVIDQFAYINTLGSINPDLANLNGSSINYFEPQDGWTMFTIPSWSKAKYFRVGMELKFVTPNGVNILDEPAIIKAVSEQANGYSILVHEKHDGINIVDVANEQGIDQAHIYVIATAPRVLNFTPGTPEPVNQMVPRLPIVITGINIIDDLLLWTDAYSEPKKINITRCKAGTNINDWVHTKLFVSNKDGDLVDASTVSHQLDQGNALYGSGTNSDLKEEHITVIRKAPTAPLTLEMNANSRADQNEVAFFHQFIDNITSTSVSIGQVLQISDTTFENTSFRVGDVLEIRRDDSAQDTVLSFTAVFQSYLNTVGDEVTESTQVIRIKLLSTCAMEADDVNWLITLQQPKPLFELKLARFGYRYKYEDGEYSSFSPWSEVAFIPRRFEYTIGEAHNLGMINDVRELAIRDFIPYNIPLDVREIDILYKVTDNSNVYVVDTIKKNLSSEWELFTPDGLVETIEIKTGYLNITSEMIHRVLPANQILRAWDNVPRTALAQEITGNRLLYGNYTQGYNLNEPVGLLQSVESENILYGTDKPKKSIKSIRDYKIGMVFGDKYGRETPVFASSYTTADASEDGYTSLTGDISLPKSLAAKSSSFIVSQIWGDPNVTAIPPVLDQGGWIDYVKYYVKETSNEYYNLVMDRWYDSGDHGTMWISFNSADRNKVDEETYLIQKNVHGTNDPIVEEARYKIIAIENEAPDYIKTNVVELGRVRDLTGTETFDTMFANNSGVPATDVPENLYSDAKISIDKMYWQQSVVGGESQDGTDSPVFGRDIKGRIKMRVVGRSSTTNVELKSQWRYIAHYAYGELEGGAGEQVVGIAWDKKWISSDVNMKNRFETIALYDNDYNVANLLYDLEFAEEVIENKPEFDGKFFVKIKRDNLATANLQGNIGNSNFEHKATYPLHYIESKQQNQHQMIDPPSGDDAVDYEADFTDATWFGGAFVDFIAGGGDNSLFDNAAFLLDDGANTPSLMANPTGSYNDMTYDGNAEFTYSLVGFEFEGSGTSLSAYTEYTYYGTYGLPNLMTIEEDGVWYAFDQINTSGGPVEGAAQTSLYPVAGTPQSQITQFSPFGSCSENYNDMTRNFWSNVYPYSVTEANGYIDGKIKTVLAGAINPGEVNSLHGSTGAVFLDACNMARMKIRSGPHADTAVDPGSSDGEPYTTGPNGLVEGGFAGFDKYWKPINAFHVGEAKANGLTLVEEGTMGSMCLSYSGAATENHKPAFFDEMSKQGTYFKFDNDPSGTVYKVIGILRSSNGWGLTNVEGHQYNWRGNNDSSNETNIPPIADFGGATSGQVDFAPGDAQIMNNLDTYPDLNADGIVNGIEMADCDVYPVSTSAYSIGVPRCAVRHTMWVEFRKVDPNNPTAILNSGINLSEFDPRAFMKHDGSQSVNVTILSFVHNAGVTEFGEETQIEDGACFETEPKEDIGLDIYYEASGAIPMVLNKDNVFNFAPINSKVSIKRQDSDTNTIDVVEFNQLTKDHKVSNVHFSGNVSDQAIIAVSSTNVNSGETALHKTDIAIGDEILFEHSDGLVTSGVVKNYWSPLNPSIVGIDDSNNFTDDQGNTVYSGGFYNLTTTDDTVGIVSGPKSFQKTSFGLQSITATVSSVAAFTTSQSSEVSQGMFLHSVSVTDQGGNSQSYNIDSFGLQVGNVLIDDNSNAVFTFEVGGNFAGNWIYNYSVQDGEEVTLVLQQPTGYYGIDINVWDRPVQLAWHNCWSFGNGVESDRIRDDFNAPQLDNGVKASTTLSEYGEENISSGLIYSGLYNSTSQLNNLNEFNQAEKISKELNPVYGAIQTMKTRDTDLVVFTEDKVLKILSNKDAVFNADGNSQLTSTNKVLGTAIPFAGDYGISNNPESLAVDQYRMYFTDKQRGTVLRLSQDGLTPISSIGMRSYFRDKMRYTKHLIGSWDPVSREYNLTKKFINSIGYGDTTVSFSEEAKGWVSFKSFVPDTGVSVAGRYLTTYRTSIYQHHADQSQMGAIVGRNNFYGTQSESQINISFNDMPSTVKSYMTVNYEGSQARITKSTPATLGTAAIAYTGEISFDGDGNPIESITNEINIASQWGKANNLGSYKTLFDIPGWYCSSIRTDLSSASTRDFKNKEGKWFTSIKGLNDILGIIDTNQFNIQGIGQLSEPSIYTGMEPYEGEDDGGGDEFGCPEGYVLMSNGDCMQTVVYGCLDSNACNYDPEATANDDSLCEYNCQGCTDPLDPLYDSTANVSNTSFCQGYVNGCMDDGNQPWSPYPGTAALNYDPTASQAGYLMTISGAPYGLPDTYSFNQTVWPDGTVNGSQPECNTAPDYYYGCCQYPAVVPEPDPFVDPSEEELSEEEEFIQNCEESGGLYMFLGDMHCVGCTTVGNESYNPQATVNCGDVQNLPGAPEQYQCVSDIETYPLAECECCKPVVTDDIIGCTDMTACNYNENATLGCVNNECCSYMNCYCCDEETADNFNNLAGTNTPLDEPHEDCIFFASYAGSFCTFGTGPITQNYGCIDPGATNYAGDEAVENGMLSCPEGTCDDLFDQSWCDCCNYPTWTEEEDDGDGDEGGDDIDTEEPQCFNADGSQNPNCGCTDNTYFNYCSSCTISCENCCIAFVYGCTDPTAFNYNEDANTDDGSCVAVIEGCTDPNANNYADFANVDDGSCDYYVPTPGCTDSTAFNYDPEADEDDGSCNALICGCMDETAINYNPDANTIYAFLTQEQIANGVNNINDPDIDTSMCPEAICEYEVDSVITLNVNISHPNNWDYENDYNIDSNPNPWPNTASGTAEDD